MLTKKDTKALRAILDAPGTGVTDIEYDREADILTVIASSPARDFGVLNKSYHLFIDQGYFKARYDTNGDLLSHYAFSRMFRDNADVHPDIAGEDTAEKPSDDLGLFYIVIDACDKVGAYPCFIDVICPTPSVHEAGSLPDFTWEDNDLQVDNPSDAKVVREFVSDLQQVFPQNLFLLAVWLRDGLAGIQWCTKETLDFEPPTPHWRKEESAVLYEEDETRKTRTLTSFHLGDRNVREHREGVLADFFKQWDPERPEDCLYRLLTEFYGIRPKKIGSEQEYWEDMSIFLADDKDDKDDEDLPFPDTPWALAEDTETPWPLHQRVCLYERCGRRVYTRTDLDDDRGREGICEVYTGWYGFLAGPIPDIAFKDTADNRALFLKALESARTISACCPETEEKTFLETLRERMGDAVIVDFVDS